jgi:metal-responsive CopG/Arc/MetJ family transcriptional regulator
MLELMSHLTMKEDMETIELKVDESLLAEVDRATQRLSMTRADFARAALELALRNQKTIALEQQHAKAMLASQSNPASLMNEKR